MILNGITMHHHSAYLLSFALHAKDRGLKVWALTSEARPDSRHTHTSHTRHPGAPGWRSGSSHQESRPGSTSWARSSCLERSTGHVATCHYRSLCLGTPCSALFQCPVGLGAQPFGTCHCRCLTSASHVRDV